MCLAAVNSVAVKGSLTSWVTFQEVLCFFICVPGRFSSCLYGLMRLLVAVDLCCHKRVNTSERLKAVLSPSLITVCFGAVFANSANRKRNCDGTDDYIKDWKALL